MDDDTDGESSAEVVAVLESMVEHIMAARFIASDQGEDLIAYFLDMALHEIASRGPVKLAAGGWN